MPGLMQLETDIDMKDIKGKIFLWHVLKSAYYLILETGPRSAWTEWSLETKCKSLKRFMSATANWEKLQMVTTEFWRVPYGPSTLWTPIEKYHRKRSPTFNTHLAIMFRQVGPEGFCLLNFTQYIFSLLSWEIIICYKSLKFWVWKKTILSYCANTGQIYTVRWSLLKNFM